MDTSIHSISVSSSGCDNYITNLTCGIEDRLILDAFDTQHDFKTIAGTICGLSHTDIGMHNGLRADFSLAQLGRSILDCRQEARCICVCIAYYYSDAGVEITILIQLTRVTSSEELIRVVSGISSAKRLGRC